MGTTVMLAVVVLALGMTLMACSGKGGDKKEQTFTVTYDFNYEGKEDETLQVKEGEKAENKQAQRDGYVLKGWFLDENGSSPYSFGEAVTADVTLYAKWAKTFKITYEKNYEGCDAADVVYVEEGKIASDFYPALADRGDIDFVGWATSADATEPDFDPTTATVSADITVYAVWAKTYTVEFYDGFGTLVKEDKVREGENAIAPFDVEYPDEYLKYFYKLDKWDAPYTKIHADAKINAIYKYVPTDGEDYYTYTPIEDGNAWKISMDYETTRDVNIVGLPDSYQGKPVKEIAYDAENGIYGVGYFAGRKILYIPGSIKKVQLGAIHQYVETVVFGEGVEEILAGAFSRSYVKNLVLPESLKVIEPYAFIWAQNIENIKIAEGSSFSYDEEQKVLYGNDGKEIVWVSTDAETLTVKEGVEQVNISAASWRTNLRTIIIKAKGLICQPSSFSYLQNLTEIRFEDGGYIKEIRGIEDDWKSSDTNAKFDIEGGFYRATQLTSIEFPYGLEYLGRGCMVYAMQLNSITVPSSLKTWSLGAINNTANATLTTIQMKDKSGSLVTQSENGKIHIENNAVIERGGAKDGGDLFILLAQNSDGNLENGKYQLPGGITEIQPYAFTGLTKITHVVIPEGVTEIPAGCFIGVVEKNALYSTLAEVTFPSTLKKINSTVVGYSMKDFEVTTEGSFRWCVNLKKINWPEDCQVTEVGNEAFVQCGFETLHIPDSIENLNARMFPNCPNLKSFEIDENSTKYSVHDGVLYDKEGKKLLIYPNGKTDSVFVGPETLEEIPDSAFIANQYITEFKPTSLKKLGRQAFYGATKLKVVILPANFEFLSGAAFSEVLTLQTVEFKGENVPTLEKGHGGFFDHSYKLPNMEAAIEIIQGLKLICPRKSFGAYYAAFYNVELGTYVLDYSKNFAMETFTPGHMVGDKLSEFEAWTNDDGTAIKHEYKFMVGDKEMIVPLYGAIAVDKMPVPDDWGGKYFQGWYAEEDKDDAGDTSADKLVKFPLYVEGSVTLYARFDNQRTIQTGKDDLYAYELKLGEKRENVAISREIGEGSIHFVFDTTEAGKYQIHLSVEVYFFIYEYRTDGMITYLSSTYEKDGEGGENYFVNLEANKTYIVVVVVMGEIEEDSFSVELTKPAAAAQSAIPSIVSNQMTTSYFADNREQICTLPEKRVK